MIKQPLFVLAAALGAALFSSPAWAGECPAGQTGVDVTKPAANPEKGVTDTVLSAIDLSQEPANIAGRTLRLRKLVVQPGGVVPWHSHGDRPAIIYIVEGTITEYASNCAVPIVHKAGEVARETSATSHWWKNTGHSVVTLLSADVLHDEHDHNM
ncbi:MAG: cupin domain-containing protein [Pseudomonadota bacterium]|nr:cupin domain-containing protein [Pseudomonadota bacterium]